jgi:Fe-Mn family superoxide dismutase
MAFQLPDLPFAKDALAPVMSAETLDFHHGKHHKAYVTKTNQLLEDKPFDGASLVEVVRAAHDRGEASLFNQSAQLWNHSFFWQCLAPADGQQPGGKLQQLIDEAFGSTDDLLKALTDEAVNHFSNGWAWLILNRGKLEISSLHDADTPLVYDGMQPLFTLDLWEHAYYIDYRNARPDYVASVLGKIVNWEFVARNLDGQGASRADQEGAAAESEREAELTA